MKLYKIKICLDTVIHGELCSYHTMKTEIWPGNVGVLQACIPIIKVFSKPKTPTWNFPVEQSFRFIFPGFRDVQFLSPDARDMQF